MRVSKTALFFMLMVIAFAPAAFARPVTAPDASSFSLLGATGLFLLGAIKRKLGR